MAITSKDGYIGAAKQEIRIGKTTTRTTVAAIPFSMFDVAGFPGSGTLSSGNTANGVVPTDATAGYPTVNAVSVTGYLTRIEFGSTVACRLALFDRLFGCGAYAFNADTTLASQPSFASRVPATDYKGLELWAEAVTAFTGNPSFQVNYLDEGAAAGDTGVVASGAALIVGRMLRIPLAAGDNGISQITRVRGTVATAGTFNIWVMRRLWSGRIISANDGDVHDLFRTGMPQIYGDSALFLQVIADSTSSGLPEITAELADG
jgi:hypothetical protein